MIAFMLACFLYCLSNVSSIKQIREKKIPFNGTNRSLPQETHSVATTPSRTNVPNFLPHSYSHAKCYLNCENVHMIWKWLRLNHTRSLLSSFGLDLSHSLFFYFYESRAKLMIFSAAQLLVNFTKRAKWRIKKEYYNFEITDAKERKK